MQRLSEFLGVENADLTDEAIILLRLLGRPFLRPISLDTGEQPGDALITHLKRCMEAGATATSLGVTTALLHLVVSLMDEQARLSARGADWMTPGTIGRLSVADRSSLAERGADEVTLAAIGRLSVAERASIAVAAIRVLEGSGAQVQRELLGRIAQRLHPLPPLKGESLGVYWQLVLSRFAHGVMRDDEVPVSARTVLGKEFMAGPIFQLAQTRPFLFVDTIVPFLFDALKKGPVKDADERSVTKSAIADVLQRALPSAFRELHRSQGTSAIRIHGTLRLLASQLEVLTETGRFKDIADAVIQAAAGAGFTAIGRASKAMSFRNISEIEAGISRGRARALAKSLSGQKDALDRRLKRYADQVKAKLKQAKSGMVDPVLATNMLPYSEGIYFLIWKEVLQRAGVILELKDKPWGNVLSELLQDHLSFAVWNHVVPRRRYQNRGMRITARPLLTYKGYPLAVRRDVAERLLASLPAGESDLLVSG